jgi:hypothetical protein
MAPVYSPIDGTIVFASDGWPERHSVNLPRSLIRVFAMGVFRGRKAMEDLRVFAGNFIVVVFDRY